MTTAVQLTREFRLGSLVLPDPGMNLEPDDVREFYAMAYPELTSATVLPPEVESNILVYQFHRAVGTKGAQPCSAREQQLREMLQPQDEDVAIGAGLSDDEWMEASRRVVRLWSRSLESPRRGGVVTRLPVPETVALPVLL